MVNEKTFKIIKKKLSTDLDRLAFEADISGNHDAAMSLNDLQLCIENTKNIKELKNCLKNADDIAKEYEIVKLAIKRFSSKK